MSLDPSSARLLGRTSLRPGSRSTSNLATSIGMQRSRPRNPSNAMANSIIAFATFGLQIFVITMVVRFFG